jgi:hypothetical protein
VRVGTARTIAVSMPLLQPTAIEHLERVPLDRSEIVWKALNIHVAHVGSRPRMARTTRLPGYVTQLEKAPTAVLYK